MALKSTLFFLKYVLTKGRTIEFEADSLPSSIAFRTGKAVRNVTIGIFNQKDNSYRWVRGSAIPQFHEGETIPYQVYVIMEDITEIKKLEVSMRETETRLIQAQKVAKVGNWTLQLNTKTIIASCGADEIYGVEFKEMPMAEVHNMLLAEYRPVLEKALSDLITQNSTYDQEFKICRRKDGEIRDIHSVATYEKENNTVFGVIQDITDRKRAEEAIKENEAKFRAMVETFPLATIQSVGVEQITEYMNPTMVKLFGYTQEDIPSVAQWWVLAYPDEAYRRQIKETWTEKVKQAIATQSPITPMEALCTCKDGSKKNILWGYIPIGDKSYAFGLDITNSKRAEEVIHKQLTEKELILQEVHHRIKNNMNTVGSLLSLQADTIKEESAVHALDDAKNRIQSMSMLYDTLYRSQDYTELSVKNYLSPLVDEIVANFPNSKMVKVEKNIQDFTLDIKRLQSLGILINELITNIMKYAFKNSDKGLIIVSGTKNNKQVTISVQDDGAGIPESISFENSTGFGLQLVYALVQQLDGKIRIERGNGTKVVLEFAVL